MSITINPMNKMELFASVSRIQILLESYKFCLQLGNQVSAEVINIKIRELYAEAERLKLWGVRLGLSETDFIQYAKAVMRRVSCYETDKVSLLLLSIQHELLYGIDADARTEFIPFN